MRIAIDGSCWSNRRGFGRFTRELVTAMVGGHVEHAFTLVVDRQTAADWRPPEGCDVIVVKTRQQPTRAASAEGARSPLDLIRMGWALSQGAFDAVLFPAVYTFAPLFRRIPTLVTFHDAIAEGYPELVFAGGRARLFWRLKTWLARRQADCVLTVSESARREVSAAFSVPESDVHVVLEAASPVFRPLADRSAIAAVLEAHQVPIGPPVILAVGGISPHKNLQALVRAVARLGPEPHLVIVGDHSHDSFLTCYRELRAECDRLGLAERVTFTGFVPDEDLVALYNAAHALALPSLAEGFGLPAMEAMACGLPVAASRRGSLPEIVGDAGVFFEPLDPEDIATALRRLLQDTELRTALGKAGLARAARHSWKEAADTTVRLIERTVRGA